MAKDLDEYNRKRDFTATPEPEGIRKSSENELKFVVQRHQASRLHYDFRLEIDGVLKSWAVPKGPSLNPGDKRLAVMTEDHPYEYLTFKGTIPEGHYGAGIMHIWDTGTFHAIGTEDPKESEEIFKEGLKKGDLKLVMHGSKLMGEFALVKMKRAGEDQWLLMKHRDNYAVTDPYTAEDYPPFEN